MSLSKCEPERSPRDMSRLSTTLSLVVLDHDRPCECRCSSLYTRFTCSRREADPPTGSFPLFFVRRFLGTGVEGMLPPTPSRYALFKALRELVLSAIEGLMSTCAEEAIAAAAEEEPAMAFAYGEPPGSRRDNVSPKPENRKAPRGGPLLYGGPIV